MFVTDLNLFLPANEHFYEKTLPPFSSAFDSVTITG